MMTSLGDCWSLEILVMEFLRSDHLNVVCLSNDDANASYFFPYIGYITFGNKILFGFSTLGKKTQQNKTRKG